MGADHRGEDSDFSRMEVLAMIYELRVYQPVPGQMPKLLARFRDKLLPIWERHGIHPIGFWTTLVGESSNERRYLYSPGKKTWNTAPCGVAFASVMRLHVIERQSTSTLPRFSDVIARLGLGRRKVELLCHRLGDLGV